MCPCPTLLPLTCSPWSEEGLSASQHPPAVQAALAAPMPCLHPSCTVLAPDLSVKDPVCTREYQITLSTVSLSQATESCSLRVHTPHPVSCQSIMCTHPAVPSHSSCVPLCTARSFPVGKSGNRANALPDPRQKASPLPFPASPNTRGKRWIAQNKVSAQKQILTL